MARAYTSQVPCKRYLLLEEGREQPVDDLGFKARPPAFKVTLDKDDFGVWVCAE
jgi:hypothetical protein